MLIVLLVVCLILTLLNMVLFQGSVATGIVSIALCVTGILIQILKKQLAKCKPTLLTILCLVCSAVLIWVSGTGTKEGSIQGYEDQLLTVKEYLEKGKLDEAVAALEEMTQEYGSDDNIVLLGALESLFKGNYEEAYSKLRSVRNKKAQMYYAVLEQVYIADPSAESVREVYKLYQEAAAEWPDWTYMQKYAGIAYLEQGLYAEADYYLRRAVDQDAQDSRSWYYLGVTAYQRGDYETCRLCFNEALEQGASEETKGNIVWYMQQLQAEGSEEG